MKNDRSKIVFANALIELSEKKALTEITVTDITDYCGLSRTSFYYHFKDKQELIYWIYTAFRDKNIELSVESSRDNISRTVTFMHRHASFFKQAFADSGQNCFRNEFRQAIYRDTITLMDENNGLDLGEEKKRLIAAFYTNITVDAVELMLDAQTEDIDEAADVLNEILKSSQNVIENFKPPLSD